ncbi:Ig-like domain-containing protein [Microbacterium terricola]|uniref:Fibronectin type III n=1 Tax=Microbacterium terricola TaxID=344163 RepID=A0ABM8DVU5_9MICO|nr:Ig-like domain-containing protein [Microbacterium terricola]UYK39568.1 Ig-like domain-containing protein [Microbacterium terricola]BDV29697.1 fibronectin type III [Microbacterium terricola]
MRRRTAIGLGAGVAAIALVVGISVVWPGLDAQETPKLDTSVWAMQTGEGSRYARVNTTVGELDTVRSISNPSGVVQSANDAFLLSDSYSKLTPIDQALPVDLDQEALKASESTPGGTTEVVTSGDFVAYRTDTGAVHVGRLSSPGPAQIDPFADADGEDAPQYTADAIAVDRRGMLFAYSSADGSVLRYDIAASEVKGRDELADAELTTPVISAAGDDWVLVDAEDGDVWVRGSDGAGAAAGTAGTAGTVVAGEPDPDGDVVYFATETGLVRISTDGEDITTVVGAGTTVIGEPAKPVVFDGETYAAWLPPGEGDGVLWSASGGQIDLGYGGRALGDERRPAFVASDDAIILNETRSGWVWTVPDGALVESSLDWTLDDQTNPDTEPSEEQLDVQIDPKPPIAVADDFGVREGSLVTLPVLMNDHDPNLDVLSIDPTSVTGLDPGFGTVTLTDDSQRLAVRVEPGATGSATFSYTVTDGTAADGLLSEPATVTLTVSPDAAGSAPEWCGVEACQLEWPKPEVERGGTVTVPVLPGWVDPDGDPLLLLSVQNTTDVGTAAATPTGEVVYQHSDDGSGGEELIELAVTIADTTGDTTTKMLTIRVSAEPELTVQSFAVVDSIDSELTVDVADHVTGTAGQVTLEAARVLDDAEATATVVSGTTSFDFSATTPGTYRVGFTVRGVADEQTGTARITLLPSDASAQLATSPVIAFVRPQEDATLDVFTAVSNPTGRVLLLSDVTARADDGATLSVDAVGQNHLRVSGSTETGASGRLGTVSYTVSDGTSDRGSQVAGEATVYLLPEAPELAPIAVDDRVVVRAGSQIDIPVLDNDIAPSGGKPALNPAAVTSSSPDALAFASGDVVRYLAPTEPGDYDVVYSVYTIGAPTLAATATVRLQVLADDANRAPLPETLEGRVLSGQSTVIEFDGFGMDPDGDVVSLSRIEKQPEQGAATIAADGESISYTSVPGQSGQVSFRYRVVDAFGKTGVGTVRIGVLDADSNPSPVTFTDYVQVQAGQDNEVRVSPLANDVDPTENKLRLTSVRPDTPATLAEGEPNPEYQRLDDRIVSASEDTVVIAAGTEPTTMSFLYDVESGSGNTGRGLIVVRVVRESVPDYPIVADTLLTSESREDFPSGVDVLQGKVSWSGGETDSLEVSLWGDPPGVDVAGWDISGALPETTRIIPFAVTGTGVSGDVTTYAFLRVPGDDDLTLSLRQTTPVEVAELESVTFDMADLVARPSSADIQVGSAVRASGAREAAVCKPDGGTTVRYDAGEGAPWADACQVPVRVVGEKDWTYLSVPIEVVALDPQPELKAASLTVGPGETTTFDLRSMTSWQLGREDWDDIAYAVDGGESSFDATLDGSVLTVTGHDDAVPGAEDVAMVSVTSHTAVSPVRLILRVGAAPSTLPKGGSVTEQCSQASGSSCSITVVGASGEINPLPRTPLEVVGVEPSGACVGVSFEVASAAAVTASWTGEAPGATCSATFSVRDAQGRSTNAERNGRILLDLQGYPKAPASIAQTAYADGSLTLRVAPGQASQAYPGLTGFIVREGAEVVAECTAAGVCPAIDSPNGEQREFTAVAVNDVGESKGSVRTVAWAYNPPAKPGPITVTPVVTADGAGGVVALTIDGVDAGQTGSLEIASESGETVRVAVSRGQTRVDVPSFRVGSNSSTRIAVTPASRFEFPPGLPGSQTGETAIAWGNGVGTPLDLRLALSSSSNGDGTSTISATASATPNGDGSTLRFGIVQDGRACVVGAEGERSVTFGPLADGEEYAFVACAESWVDGRSFGHVEVRDSQRAEQSRDAPQGWTFVVRPTPNVYSGRAEWVIADEPTSPERPPRNNRVEFQGSIPSNVFGSDPRIDVRYVHRVWGTATPWAAVVPAAGSAPYQVQASWRAGVCRGGDALELIQSSTGNQATVSFDPSTLQYLDAAGAVVPHEAGTWTVPVGAVTVTGIGVTVSWANTGWNLAATDRQTLSADCDPNNPAPAEPAP